MLKLDYKIKNNIAVILSQIATMAFIKVTITHPVLIRSPGIFVQTTGKGYFLPNYKQNLFI